MTTVTVNAVYSKLLQVEQEVREIRSALIPEAKISKQEHEELDKTLTEMKSGKEKNWREIIKQ